MMPDYFELLQTLNGYIYGRDTYHACSDCNDDCSECERQQIVSHSMHVFMLCGLFVKLCPDLTINEEYLLTAAILHDIAKLDDKDNHQKRMVVAAVIRKNVVYLSPDEMNAVLEIVHWHRGKEFSPKKDLAIESAILRMCDKLDKYRKGSKSASEKCVNTMELIEDYFDGVFRHREFEILQKVMDFAEHNLDDDEKVQKWRAR